MNDVDKKLEQLKELLNWAACDLQVNGKHTFIIKDKFALGIIQVKENSISLHFRASCFPNDIANIAGMCFSVFPDLLIGDTFEILVDGTEDRWLFGQKALRHAAENMYYYWFPEEAYYEKDMNVAIDEVKNLNKEELN